jgi:hypothetical protein
MVGSRIETWAWSTKICAGRRNVFIGSTRSHIDELFCRIENNAINRARIAFVRAQRELSFPKGGHRTAWGCGDGGRQHKHLKEPHDV